MSEYKQILIIDDEITILESLASFFEDEGYIVFCAENGNQGLEIFDKEKIDIVLTDLRMPGKDGIEVMKSIQAGRPGTPMIVVSGAGEKEDIINALRMGAKDYITKPIEDLDIIGHTVSQVLETKRLSDENKAYREKLEKSETRYRTITENIAEGVFSVNQKETITYANQVFCDMTGYFLSELSGRNLKDLTTPESFEIISKQTLERQAGGTDRFVIEFMTRSRESLHAELACSPVFGSSRSEYQGSIIVARDITYVMELRKKYRMFLDQNRPMAKDVTPICANCKSIRVKKGQWIPVEKYFNETMFSHGICPECCKTLYSDLNIPD